MNILEFLDNDQLTPGTFDGDSWEPWRAVLSGAFALPMEHKRLALFTKLTGGRKPPAQRVSELIVIAGRRSAKTNTTAGVAVYLATIGVAMEGLADKLKPGERGVVSCIAVDRDQAKVLFSYIAGIFDESPVLSAMIEKRGAESLELNNRITIEVATNSFRSVRGKTRIAALLDEAAFFADETSATPDVELYRALAPSLASTGGMMIVITSPWAKRGLVFNKWKQHYGQDSDDVMVIQGSTEIFNPTIDKRIIRNAQRDDPESYRSEWMGLFRDNISGFIDREQVEKVMRQNPLELPFVSGTRYTGVADCAGGGADEYAMAIGHVENGITIIDVLRARRGTPAEITAEYAQVFKDYGVQRIVTDRYAGYWSKDEFAKHGIECDQSAKPKSELYLDSLSRFASEQIELPPDDKMMMQFCSLERRTARGGRTSVDHPPGKGSHDDRANACSLLMDVASGKKKPTGSILLPNRRRGYRYA